MRCLLCRRVNDQIVCMNCWQYALSQLKKFPDKYNELEAELLPSKGYGERVAGTKTPPLPVRLETLYLRTGGISHNLMLHEAQIRIIQKHTKITWRGEEIHRITKTCEYLTTHEKWIYENYEDIDQLTKDIQDIAGKINFVLGQKSDEITIGTCPSQNENGEICGAILRINPNILLTFADIKCRACDTVWKSDQWRLLGRILETNEQSV